MVALNNYRSVSGKVADYLLKLLEPQDYVSLVHESLTQLKNNPPPVPEEFRNEQELYDTVLQNKKDTLRKTLQRVQESSEDTRTSNKYEGAQYTDEGYPILNNDVVTIILEHVYEQDVQVRQAEDNPKEPVSSKAKIRKYIESRLPITKYRRQFMIREDKVDAVLYVPDVAELSTSNDISGDKVSQ